MPTTEAINLGTTLGALLTAAWLLPLAGFAVEIFGGFWGTRKNKAAAYLAVACIGTSFLLSAAALVYWGQTTHWTALKSHEGEDPHGGGAHAAPQGRGTGASSPRRNREAHGPSAGRTICSGGKPAGHSSSVAADTHVLHPVGQHEWPRAFSGTIYVLAQFGFLRFAVDYYIDSLTLVMFTMVTLIASLIHLFAIGYMSDELTENYEDHQVHTSHGHLHRPGRFYRFFAFLSLFSFSMLGLVLAGNVFMVFIFWELVGVCSYFLIGFYVERKSASTAANKAFIMNRVGDFGFLIGLMILLSYFGTFQFADRVDGSVTRKQSGCSRCCETTTA